MTQVYTRVGVVASSTLLSAHLTCDVR